MAGERVPTNHGPRDQPDGAILVAGQRVAVDGARVVTFLDDRAWDFSALGDVPTRPGRYVEARRIDGPQPREVVTLADAQDVIDMVVLHSDITVDARQGFQVLQARGFSTHFLLDWDGTLYQATDVAKMAIHAASPDFRKNINNFAIGIDLNCLQVNCVGGKPAAQGNGERRLSDVIEINNVLWQSWGYTDAQYDTLIALLKTLAAVLPKLKLMAPLAEDNAPIWSVVAAHNPDIGIYGHLHLTAEKFDPGPGFDWHRLVYGLNEETQHFPVALADPQTGRPLTLARLRGDAEIARAADAYFLHTELAGKGGCYPIGLSGQWHGGVHFFVPRGTEVRAMTDGVVVAARNGPPGPLGSANFVLLRHEVLFGDPSDARRFVFFSLYMHLLAFDSDRIAAAADTPGSAPADPDAAPAWLTLGAPATTPKRPQAHDDDEDAPPSPPLVPSVGQGVDALRRGEVALLPLEGPNARRVAAGAVIGRVGEMGDEDDVEALLHVEVFANSAWRNVVDLLGTHARFWYEVEPDLDDNLVIDAASLRAPLLPERAAPLDPTFLNAPQRIHPDDVEAFYRTPDDPPLRNRLRMAITRHVSEWSDQVDWVKALASAQAWDDRARQIRDLLEADGQLRDALFARQIARQLPFLWLTEDVARHVGVASAAWDGVLDHFHPIHFILWLAFHSNTRVRELAKGKSRRQIAADQAHAKERAEAARAAGEWPDFDRVDVDGALADAAANPESALEALWDAPQQPGEWRRGE